MSPESAQARAALGERLTKSLQFADLSPSQMADRLGITEPTVQSWLAGTSSPRLAHLMIWARASGVPFEWLTGTDEP
ncbi:MAG TPA: helix-turn-helix transcriptional regulator [Amnibacterium sp.]|jgi:transcriptional regulator with XRE-family HTH domain|uniref:helix-turn-helix domain-containing protein n=1 Tax=Amnibacterium sp. TaxID=1872496 RepID=UPI002F931247